MDLHVISSYVTIMAHTPVLVRHYSDIAVKYNHALHARRSMSGYCAMLSYFQKEIQKHGAIAASLYGDM